MDRPPESCTEIESALPLYVGADLEAAEMKAVASHLDTCMECRALADRTQIARDVLGTLRGGRSADPSDGPDLWAGIRERLYVEGVLAPAEERAPKSIVPTASRTPAPIRRWPLGRVAAAAAAVLVAFGLAQLGGRGPTSPSPKIAAPIVASGVELPSAVPLALPVGLQRAEPGDPHLVDTARPFRSKDLNGASPGSHALAGNRKRIIR